MYRDCLKKLVEQFDYPKHIFHGRLWLGASDSVPMLLRLLFQEMVHDVASLYADLIKAAFFPNSAAGVSVTSNDKQSCWRSPVDGLGSWLPSCVRYVRYTSIL